MSENTFERNSVIKPYRSFYNHDAMSNAEVYIVSRNKVAEVEKIKKDPDVIVVDSRKSADPNMQVRQSYKLMTKKSKAAIIQILLDYNAEYPTTPAWNRTFNSLMGEWALHNIAYLMKFKPERTADVDFNNGDEKKSLLDFMEGI